MQTKGQCLGLRDLCLRYGNTQLNDGETDDPSLG